MKNSFENENPGKNSLRDDMLEPFYVQMRNSVVVIEAYLTDEQLAKQKELIQQEEQLKQRNKRKHKRCGNRCRFEATRTCKGPTIVPGNKGPTTKGTGVFINVHGLILTCAHVVEGYDGIMVRFVDFDDFDEAELVDLNIAADLAIIKRKGDMSDDTRYVDFADVESVTVGMQVTCISNTQELTYSFTVGQVAYPCNTKSLRLDDTAWNITKGCRLMNDSRGKKDTELMSFRDDLKVIQINNTHGKSGGSGGPIFDTRGHLVGIFAFISKGFDFAIHVSELVDFIKKMKQKHPNLFGTCENEKKKCHEETKEKGKKEKKDEGRKRKRDYQGDCSQQNERHFTQRIENLDGKMDQQVEISKLIKSEALLSLCSDESVSAKGALDLCINQMKNVLSSQQLPENVSMETIGRAYRARETFVQIDVFPLWTASGHALIRMEHYAQARVKFKQALQLHKGDPVTVVVEIINTIEGGPPADVSSVRSMYEHLAKSAPAILDDSLYADSHPNVFYMLSTFPWSERSRRSLESTDDNSINRLDFDDGPRSNLDGVGYLECVNYLQEYARQNLLAFMFRHGHYKDACILFFPPNSVPPPPQLSSLGGTTSSSLPQRPDPLATEYVIIDDLCDLYVGYGSIPVLENVLSVRVSVDSQDVLVNQYTAAALARVCIYCETHKNFNYLNKFQVIKKDHVAAGPCCIQLVMNSSSQEEAIKHLENAKMHFDEGLSARYKAGESTKLVTKGVHGKSASEKLTEEGLVKFSARVAIQVDVVKSFIDTDGPQWKHSLFGNPNDPKTFRRRCELAETLTQKNFDLALQVIYEFNLPAVDIYAAVAASLVERKKAGQLTEFFRNIKGTIDDDDWDQVLGAAINVYANKHKERPDRLIDMLTSSHRKYWLVWYAADLKVHSRLLLEVEV